MIRAEADRGEQQKMGDGARAAALAAGEGEGGREIGNQKAGTRGRGVETGRG